MALFHKILFDPKYFIYRSEQLCYLLQIDWRPIKCLNEKCQIHLARMALFHKILNDPKCCICRAKQLCYWLRINSRPLNGLKSKVPKSTSRMALFSKKLDSLRHAVYGPEQLCNWPQVDRKRSPWVLDPLKILKKHGKTTNFWNFKIFITKARLNIFSKFFF